MGVSPSVLMVVDAPQAQRATEEHEEDDDEVMGDDLPWTHPPFTAEQFIPPPNLAKAASALADPKLLIQPCQTSGIGYKDPRLNLLL